MYGDTSAIRRLASELRHQADDIRAEADRLLGRAESVSWQGWTADAMRGHARLRVDGLHRTARAHDAAAEALDRHAAEVDRRKEAIAAIERRAHRLVAEARARLAGLTDQVLEGAGRVLADPLDELLDRFVPPPPGHRDWLTVELPGLHR